MHFRCLGALQVTCEGQVLDLGGPKQRALLAILLLHANEVVSSDRLIDLLWGEEPPASARKVLQLYVSQLRKVLGAGAGEPNRLLVTASPGYVLALERDAFDLHRFEDLVREARGELDRRSPAGAVARLTEALELWRGEPLADFRFEPFAQAEIARLEEMRLSARLDRAEAYLELGRHLEAIAELAPLTAVYATSERLALLLMLALYRGGRQAEALDAYRRIRATLVEELGIEPGPDLEEMQRKILVQDDSLRWVPPRSHPSPNNLPAPATSFIGRASEVDAVTDRLRRHRLVTLTGAGGCGKSRLALEAAIAILAERSDGVWLVELAPVGDARLVDPLVATTLGLKEEPGRAARDAIVAGVGDKAVLLLLDNCEHLIETCAATVEALLLRCPRLTVLATSREPLGVPGEVVWNVPPLSFPGAEEDSIGRFEDYDAVRLFADRASALVPDFRLSNESAPTVATICRRLDGMPLAIELAAARVRVMPVTEIAARLDDRFLLLTRGSRTAPPRHRTLRAVIDWSFRLLSGHEQAVLSRLSVFVGGFSPAAARSVCPPPPPAAGSVLDTLSDLVDKSLVVVDRRSDDVRYRLLESVREYAREAMEAGEAEDAHARHADYCLALAREGAGRLQGSEQRAWLEVLEQEHDNVRLALRWFSERGRHRDELRLATSLWRSCYLRGRYAEARAWLERGLEHDDVEPSLRAEALSGAGGLAFYQCDYGHAERRLRAALELYRELDDKRGTASVLSLLGGIARERGEYDRCLEFHAEAIATCRDAGDRWGMAHSLQMAGFASWLRGSLEVARKSSGEALARFRELGDEERIAWALMDLGAVAHYRGEEREARRLLQRALSSFDGIGFKEGVAWSYNLTALVEVEHGDLGTAVSLLHDSFSLHRDLGDRWRICSVLEALATTACRTGWAEAAGRLLGAAERLRRDIGTPVPPCERPGRDETVARLGEVLGDGELEHARAAGRAMTLDDIARLIASMPRAGDGAPAARGASPATAP